MRAAWRSDAATLPAVHPHLSEEHVFQFDVAVDEPTALVHVPQRASDADERGAGLLLGKRLEMQGMRRGDEEGAKMCGVGGRQRRASLPQQTCGAGAALAPREKLKAIGELGKAEGWGALLLRRTPGPASSADFRPRSRLAALASACAEAERTGLSGLLSGLAAHLVSSEVVGRIQGALAMR